MASFRMQERDLDLFILEELHSDSGFDSWLGERVGLERFACREAEHSVSAKSNAKWGETDVLALFSKGAETVAVLIEDKIAAEFTDRQAERYRERAADLVKIGKAHRALTVLVAPSIYLARVPADEEWDKKVPIEELRDWFAATATVHASWRAKALDGCLERVRPALTPGREDVMRFSLELSAYLAQHHSPTLAHKPGKDATGPTIRYPGDNVNKMLWWKVATHQMTMQLMGPLAGHAAHMELPESIGCERAGDFGRKCDYLIMDVPPIDFSTPLEAQRDVVETALSAAYRLIAFLPEIEARAILRDATPVL